LRKSIFSVVVICCSSISARRSGDNEVLHHGREAINAQGALDLAFVPAEECVAPALAGTPAATVMTSAAVAARLTAAALSLRRGT
jgi:hypothetical protein